VTARPLGRRLLAEFVGTALLVTAVVGSGIMATTLSPDQTGLQLLQNSIATALALGALILTFGPISGAHFNPVVSAADWFFGRRSGTGLSGTDLAGYIAAQTTGAIGGAVLANLMFALPAISMSDTERTGPHLWLGEVIAPADCSCSSSPWPDPAAAASHPPPWAPTSAPPTGSPPPPASPTPPSPSAAPSPTRSPASHRHPSQAFSPRNSSAWPSAPA
jgi:hypothetical protein